MEAKASKRRRLLLWIVVSFIFITLFCLCSGLALAWTYGDAILEGLQSTININ
jgi:hypothetical protein